MNWRLFLKMPKKLNKLSDRLEPKSPQSPWSSMEEWGGTSWFTPDNKKEEKENGTVEKSERYADSE